MGLTVDHLFICHLHFVRKLLSSTLVSLILVLKNTQSALACAIRNSYPSSMWHQWAGLMNSWKIKLIFLYFLNCQSGTMTDSHKYQMIFLLHKSFPIWCCFSNSLRFLWSSWSRQPRWLTLTLLPCCFFLFGVATTIFTKQKGSTTWIPSFCLQTGITVCTGS